MTPDIRPILQAETQRAPGKVKTLFGLSLCVFLVLNASLTFFAPIHFDPYKFNYKGWTWWMMDDLRNHNNGIHNVAVLGSSTMVSAIAGCDANHLNKSLDLTRYHKVSYLENLLSKNFNGMFDSFSLAAPGQMPSDAFLTLKAMAATGNRPDVVIYGVAPRDFIDSTLAGPNDTEPFRYLTRIVNIDDVGAHVFRNLFCKLDWYLQRNFFIYEYAMDFRLLLGDAAEVSINTVVPRPWTNKPFTWWDRVKLLPEYLPAECHAEAVMATPLDRKTAETQYKDNTIEYQARYKKPDEHTYKTQMYFLRKMVQYCHKERIELILVNMPITWYNVNMLKPGVYPKYLHGLEEFAWNNNIIFYDLCDFKRFTRPDFHDSVHLNAFGGARFFEELTGRMLADRRACAALNIAGLKLESHSQLAGKRESREQEIKRTVY